MQMLRGVVLALCTVLLCVTLAPGARADQWDKKTVVTFGEDVEIPGQILPAGTYIFRLANTISDRHIVQIWSAEDDQLIATTMTIPDTRLDPYSRSKFEFDERPTGSPMALKVWFYPGSSTGEEFVYSNQSYSDSYSIHQ
jgi:hypothetical protein